MQPLQLTRSLSFGRRRALSKTFSSEAAETESNFSESSEREAEEQVNAEGLSGILLKRHTSPGIGQQWGERFP